MTSAPRALPADRTRSTRPARSWLTGPKSPSGPLPLALPSRRIYIVPSRFGVVYGAALFVLLLGSLNYNNNAAILLGLVDSFGTMLVPDFPGIFFYVALAAMLLVRPKGLIGGDATR